MLIDKASTLWLALSARFSAGQIQKKKKKMGEDVSLHQDL